MLTPPKSPFARAEAIAGGDTLNIAIEFNGICYGVRGDSAFGRDYQIIERIARSRSIPVKYHPFVPLAHATEGLRDGRYDIVIASMPLTVELKQRFVMTDPVYLDREILVQHRPDTVPPPCAQPSTSPPTPYGSPKTAPSPRASPPWAAKSATPST